MSDACTPPPDDTPAWLDAFERMANERLGQGSSCAQVHPIVERWFRSLIDGAPPDDRDSVAQATACLATEVFYSLPDELIELLLAQVDADDVVQWIEQILLVGRAFEAALRSGALDDL
ncbi:MAG: hypothetical protein ACUVSX_06375 [Aggregatilineales bacterium]